MDTANGGTASAEHTGADMNEREEMARDVAQACDTIDRLARMADARLAVDQERDAAVAQLLADIQQAVAKKGDVPAVIALAGVLSSNRDFDVDLAPLSARVSDEVRAGRASISLLRQLRSTFEAGVLVPDDELLAAYVQAHVREGRLPTACGMTDEADWRALTVDDAQKILKPGLALLVDEMRVLGAPMTRTPGEMNGALRFALGVLGSVAYPDPLERLELTCAALSRKALADAHLNTDIVEAVEELVSDLCTGIDLGDPANAARVKAALSELSTAFTASGMLDHVLLAVDLRADGDDD